MNLSHGADSAVAGVGNYVDTGTGSGSFPVFADILDCCFALGVENV